MCTSFALSIIVSISDDGARLHINHQKKQEQKCLQRLPSTEHFAGPEKDDEDVEEEEIGEETCRTASTGIAIVVMILLSFSPPAPVPAPKRRELC